MNVSLLLSEQYDTFMKGSWEGRHNEEAIKKWGVWRWKGIYADRLRIITHVNFFLSNGYAVVDFGGGAAGLGLNSDVIDIADNDDPIWALKQYENIGMIFSSHMLEHTGDPEMYIHDFYAALSYGGVLYLHVPSIYGYNHWSPEAYKDRHPEIEHGHKCQFILNGREDYDHSECAGIYSIDHLVKDAGFGDVTARYCDDRSIIITGQVL